MGASAKVTVAGVAVGTGVDRGWGNGYRLSLGENASFNGGIPPIIDLPETPQDEYSDHFYRVMPIIYRETYTDLSGNTLSYYVVTYVVE